MRWLFVYVTFIQLSLALLVKDETCECGLMTHSRSGRIIGGKTAAKNAYPWIAALTWKIQQLCVASIITHWHALTAAHCSERAPAAEMGLRLGTHNLHDKTDIYIPLEKYIIHRCWSFTQKHSINDISILITKTKITFSLMIGPVCLPAVDLIMDKKIVKAMGWGKTTPNGLSSDVLREADLKVMSAEDCSKYWTGKNEIKKKICVVGEGGKNVGKGDSGGPLVWIDPETQLYTQVGIVSYGVPNGDPSFPTIHTAVFPYMDWITEQVKATKRDVSICTKWKEEKKGIWKFFHKLRNILCRP